MNKGLQMEGITINGKIHPIAYHHDGRIVNGWPASITATTIMYGTAQEFITEGANSPVAADIDGDGNDEVVVSPLLSPPHLLESNGSVRVQYQEKGFIDLGTANTITEILEVIDKIASNSTMSFTTTGAFGNFGGGLTYVQAGTGVQGMLLMMLSPGQGGQVKNFEGAYDAVTGKPKQGFPSFFQGLNFLGAPVIADVTGDGETEIIDAGDSSAMHAYTPGGTQAEGFPKFTTGWVIWSPSIGDLDGDGDVELVALTREGYLMVWDTPGLTEANTEWWHYHHDEWNTGRYGTDTRPPGIIRQATLETDTGTLKFTVPGDNWYAGTPAYYRLLYTIDGNSKIKEFTSSATLGEEVKMTIPEGATEIQIQAVDDAENIGKAVNPVEITSEIPLAADKNSSSSDDDDDLCFISTIMK